MEAIATTNALTRRRSAVALDLRAVTAWTLGFATVCYLGLRGGGYDVVVWSEAGIAFWWLVLVGIATGVLPAARLGRFRLAALAALLLFAGWQTLALMWTSSPERTVAEVARTMTYIGALALAVTALNSRTARSCLFGIGAATALIAALAVASRVRPEWFPADDIARYFRGGPGVRERLNYPVNFSDGLAALLAVGVPALLAMAGTASTLAGRAAGLACLPVVGLALFLTGSRSGILTVAVAVAVLLALDPDRLQRLGHVIIGGAAMTLMMVAATRVPAFQENLGNALAREQGEKLAVVLLVVSVGAGLLSAALALATQARSGRPARVRPRRQKAIAAALAAACAAAALAVLTPAAVDKWSEFKRPGSGVAATSHDPFTRLGDLSGSNRWQYWESAARAIRTNSVRGIGPGTFEFWWAQDGTLNEFIRDAHSLYFEAAAETGVVGLLLLLLGLGGLWAAGARAALRRRARVQRVTAAAGVAGFSAYLVSAGVNWNWEIPAITLAGLLMAAVAIAPERGDDPLRPWGLAGWQRALVVGGSAVAIGFVAVNLAATQALRESQEAAGAGNLSQALGEADAARKIQPFAAAPLLQRALVFERAGDLAAARTAVVQATDRVDADWRLWVARSRIHARLGESEAALDSYRRARSLNPRSRLFTEATPR